MHDLAIVGLGRIGSTYDAVPGAVPRSHIGAALASQAFAVRWLVDPDDAARARARKQWPQLAEASLCASVAELRPGEVDAIAFCTPPLDRMGEIETAIRLGCRVAIVEKPLCATAAEALQIAAAAERANLAVRVNFHRRLDPGHARARASCPGRPQLVVVRYGKGLLNYGSHAIDLLLDWFGPIESVRALDARHGDDPNLSVLCRFTAGFDGYLLGVDGLAYDQFDCDMLFSDRRLELANGGFERRIYRSVPDKLYSGYNHLDLDSAATEIGPVGGLAELYQAAALHLTSGAPLPGCTPQDAARGLSVIEAALRSRDAGESLVAVPEHFE